MSGTVGSLPLTKNAQQLLYSYPHPHPAIEAVDKNNMENNNVKSSPDDIAKLSSTPSLFLGGSIDKGR